MLRKLVSNICLLIYHFVIGGKDGLFKHQKEHFGQSPPLLGLVTKVVMHILLVITFLIYNLNPCLWTVGGSR